MVIAVLGLPRHALPGEAYVVHLARFAGIAGREVLDRLLLTLAGVRLVHKFLALVFVVGTGSNPAVEKRRVQTAAQNGIQQRSPRTQEQYHRSRPPPPDRFPYLFGDDVVDRLMELID